MSTIYTGNVASGEARQHNGNSYQNTNILYNQRVGRISKIKQKELNDKSLTAVCLGQIPRIKALLLEGADKDCRNQKGVSALYCAVANNDEAVIDLLVDQGADINAASSHPYGTPLTRAVLHGGIQLCKKLLEHRASAQSGALHAACDIGDEEKAHLLIKHGALVNARAKHRLVTTKLAMKTMFGEQLWPNHGHIELQDCQPLHLAALSGNDKLCKLLLEHGAEADTTCKSSFLFDDHMHGAGVLQVRALEHGWPPVFFAINAACASALLAHGADSKRQSSSKRTKVHIAAVLGDIDTLNLLLDHGAAPSIKKDTGMTALILAIEQTRCGAEHRKKLVQVLLAAGADVNSVNRSGRKAYELAKQLKLTDIAQLLEDAGADTHPLETDWKFRWPGGELILFSKRVNKPKYINSAGVFDY